MQRKDMADDLRGALRRTGRRDPRRDLLDRFAVAFLQRVRANDRCAQSNPSREYQARLRDLQVIMKRLLRKLSARSRPPGKL